jgi:ATP-binding protein involved in chromosome partitioning
MAISEAEVREALKQVKFPGLSRDIVSFGFVRSVQVEGDAVAVEIALTTANPQAGETVERDARAALEALPGVREVKLDCAVQAPQNAPAAVPARRVLPRGALQGSGGLGQGWRRQVHRGGQPRARPEARRRDRRPARR